MCFNSIQQKQDRSCPKLCIIFLNSIPLHRVTHCGTSFWRSVYSTSSRAWILISITFLHQVKWTVSASRSLRLLWKSKLKYAGQTLNNECLKWELQIKALPTARCAEMWPLTFFQTALQVADYGTEDHLHVHDLSTLSQAQSKQLIPTRLYQSDPVLWPAERESERAREKERERR